MSSFDTFHWDDRGITIGSYPTGWRNYLWPRWLMFPSGVRLRIGLRHQMEARAAGLAHDESIRFDLKRMGGEGNILGQWIVLDKDFKEQGFNLPRLSYADTYKIDVVRVYGRREELLEMGIISIHVIPNYRFYAFVLVPVVTIMLERGIPCVLRLIARLASQ